MKYASEAPFPYGYGISVCYFVVVAGVPMQFSRSRKEFREMVKLAIENDHTIYAVWPGQYRSDLFIIDKPELLADAIGLVRA